MLKAIVFALVRGWFFINRRGTDRPMHMVASTICRMWPGSLYLLSKARRLDDTIVTEVLLKFECFKRDGKWCSLGLGCNLVNVRG